MKQLQWGLGDALRVYKDFMKGQNLPVVIDKLDENRRLLWVGERRTDRVILHFHGGAFLFPVGFSVLPFWRYVQSETRSKGKEAGFAMLQYCCPRSPAPYLHGCQTGESAGGNLVFQLLSHMLHPVQDVPRLTLSAPFSAAYPMSPWVSLTGKIGSMLTNGDSDVLGIEASSYWGRIVLDGVPEKYRPYLKPYYAPEDWFADLSTVVRRVLITAGDAGWLRDDIVVFVDRLRKNYPELQFVLQDHGVHCDPYADFLWSEKVKGVRTPMISDFFMAGF
ncbi:hypothetical protein C0993_005184 [Termitomyces sp. T159_Od127]|nr:hypothetical protein C0993_005184 [Termitomyces sp. T159_Od127]